MAWWQMVLIVVAVLAVLFTLFAVFEIEVILVPKSPLSRLLGWNGNAAPMTAAQIKCKANHDAIIAKAKAWDEATPHTDRIIKTFDGLTLHATEYLQPAPSHLWAVIAHGFHAPEKEPAEYGMYYYEKGYNVLAPDDRAHGNSEGRYITMGWLDRKDFIQRINEIVARDRDAQIVLHGVSMGGATVMMVTGEPLPKNVVCAIEDCGYTSVWDEFVAQVRNMVHLPPFPLIPLCSVIAKIRCGFSFREASSVKQVRKSVTPTLFIHGEKDTFVPTAMVYRNFEAASCPKDMLVVKDAEHAQSKNQEPELYWNKVFGFIANNCPQIHS